MLDGLLYFCALGLIRLLAVLPLGCALALGRALGSLCYHVLRIRRRVVLGNLRHVLSGARSEAEIRAIAAGAYREFAMTLVEFLRLTSAGAGRAPVTEFEHLDRMRALKDGGRGVILAAAHSGNFDIGVMDLAAILAIPVYAIMRPLKNPRFNRLMVGARERWGLKMLEKGASGFHEAARVLDAGGWVAILPDQNAKRHGVAVEFLGKPITPFKGPALLHLKTGAQIVVGVQVRSLADPRRHLAQFEFLEPYTPTGDREGDVRAVTQRIFDAMGRIVLRRPEQYFWLHRLFGKEVAGG